MIIFLAACLGFACGVFSAFAWAMYLFKKDNAEASTRLTLLIKEVPSFGLRGVKVPDTLPEDI